MNTTQGRVAWSDNRYFCENVRAVLSADQKTKLLMKF